MFGYGEHIYITENAIQVAEHGIGCHTHNSTSGALDTSCPPGCALRQGRMISFIGLHSHRTWEHAFTKLCTDSCSSHRGYLACSLLLLKPTAPLWMRQHTRPNRQGRAAGRCCADGNGDRIDLFGRGGVAQQRNLAKRGGISAGNVRLGGGRGRQRLDQ